MKYRKFVLLTTFVSCSVLTHAQQVGYEVAKNIASSFIGVKKGSLQNGNSAVSQQYTEYGSQGNPLFYLFNFEGGGFVIVSADKNAEPILAYSPTGKFSMDGENPAAKDWVNVYAEEIAYAVKNNTVPTAEMVSKWEEAEKGNFSAKTQKAAVVEPLLTSKWNQNRYYNTLCPDTIQPQSMVSYDDHTPNGCVALAMAQIMYYHRYPVNGVGATAYVCTGYGEQRADYAKANYNYDAMSDVATGYSNDIAKLCYHAGVSVQMNYKADGSGALTDNAYKALAARFAYKSSLRPSSGGSDDIGWKNLLKTDLNRGLPIYYSACTGGIGVHACHAFVCDGYDDKDYFHFNWGWGGLGDGFYSLSDMLEFKYNHQIITGIEPFRDTVVSTGSDTLTATYGSFSDGSSPRVNYENNTERSWLIAPQNGRNVTRILLKTAYFSTEKDNDLVTIYKGDKIDDDSIVAVLSGNLDTSIFVNASCCFVTFTSNAAVTARGFKFTYTSTRISDNLCPAQIPTAANYHEDPQGSIANNSGDGLYEDENTCYWAIKPQDNQKVGLRFTKFDLEEGDMVELYTWNGTSGLGNIKYRTNGKYRFTKQKPPELNREYLIDAVGAFVHFRTDNNLNASGFELGWYTTNALKEASSGSASVRIFPNPTTGQLTISLPNPSEGGAYDAQEVEIYDVVGQLMQSAPFNSPEGGKYSPPSEGLGEATIKIDISHLAAGMYFLKIGNNTARFVKE